MKARSCQIALLVSLIAVLAPIKAPAQSSIITTYAGPLLPLDGTPALTQAIDDLSGIVATSDGGFYVTSRAQDRVYRVASDGTIRLVAGSFSGFGGDGGPAENAQLANPLGLALDLAGNLYIADMGNNRIRRVSTSGVITTVAGTGVSGFSGDDGPATSAQLAGPSGVAVDTDGNLYVADTANQRVRKITTDGLIHALAGTGTSGESGNGGPATSAQLERPYSVAIDTQFNVYVSDRTAIRRIANGGTISTVVRSQFSGRFNSNCVFNGDGGPAAFASVCNPLGLSVDASGNLYIADDGNQRVRKVGTDGSVSTIAGNGVIGFSGDGGLAIAAALNNPWAVTIDDAGNLYIAEGLGNRVRKVATNGVIQTVAGLGEGGFGGDGGPATLAQMNAVTGVVVDAAGNLYRSDAGNHRVRKVSPDGIIRTIAGTGTAGYSGDGGAAMAAELDSPSGLALDAGGTLYIADSRTHSVRKLTPDGMIRTVAGGVGTSPNPTNIAVSTALFSPHGLAVDSAGNLYIADGTRVRKVTTDGFIATIAGNGTAGSAGDGGPAVSAQLDSAYDVAVDIDGGVYVSVAGRIRKVSPDGIITTIAGTSTLGFSGDDGPAVSAQLYYVQGIALDAAGNLYIADANRIRKIAADSGVITTIAGNGVGGFSGDGGPAVISQLNNPVDVALDAAGSIYIADSLNDRVRKATFFAAALQSYAFASAGTSYWRAASVSATVTVGSATIRAQGGANPTGFAVFSYRSNGVLISEAAVPAAPLMQAGRIYVELSNTVKTGVAIANPNNQSATISFYFTDENGFTLYSRTISLGAHQQIAAFLDEPPYTANADARTLTFMSSVGVGVIALHGFNNERGEFLMTTIPVAPIVPFATAPGIFPHYAAGGGWTTQLLLVNPTDSPLTGTVVMDGVLAYSIAPRSSARILRTNSGSSILTGNIYVNPDPGGWTPVASTVFSYSAGGITVTESGVATTGVGQSFRIFAELDAASGMQTGIAIANAAASGANLQFDLLDLNGQPAGYSGTMPLAGNGHLSVFLREIPGFESLPASFRGALRVTSTTAISAIGLRARYNERNDFLISTTPAVANTFAGDPELVLPHLAVGGGYTTEVILMAPDGSSGTGSVQFASQSGADLSLQLIR